MLTERLDILHKKIEKKILGIKYDAVIYQNQEKLLIILSDTSENEAYNIIKNVCQQITGSLKEKEVFFASVGKTAGQLSELCDSYMIAGRIEQLIRMDGLENEIKSYSQMGIGRMLLNLKHMDSLDEYYADTIHPLDEYDEANGGNLVETLECYMLHNGSVQDTAEEMYVHRNTVNYKLKKIEAILDINLTEFEVRNQLMTGLLVKKIRCLK